MHSCSLRRMMRRWRRMSCKRWSGAGRTARNAGARCAGDSAESATTARRCGRAHGVEQRPDAGRGRALCAPGATFGKLSVKSGFCPETGPGAPRGPEGRRRRLGLSWRALDSDLSASASSKKAMCHRNLGGGQASRPGGGHGPSPLSILFFLGEQQNPPTSFVSIVFSRDFWQRMHPGNQGDTPTS